MIRDKGRISDTIFKADVSCDSCTGIEPQSKEGCCQGYTEARNKIASDGAHLGRVLKVHLIPLGGWQNSKDTIGHRHFCKVISKWCQTVNIGEENWKCEGRRLAMV